MSGTADRDGLAKLAKALQDLLDFERDPACTRTFQALLEGRLSADEVRVFIAKRQAEKTPR